jgi:heptosyltransferase-2
MPPAHPVPDKPPLHLRGGYLAVAAPEEIVDACFAVPAVRALRNGRPHATLTVTTPASLAPIWERVRGIDHVVSYPERAGAGAIAALLENTGVNYESAIAWGPSNAAKAMAKLQIRQRFGYNQARLAPHLNEPLDITSPLGPVEHRVRHFLLLVEKLGIDAFVPASFRTPPLPPRPDPPRIALCPGSEFGPAFQWPIDRFAETASRLQDQCGAEIVILSMPGVTREADALAGQLGERADNRAGNFQLGELLDALSHCSTLIASDGVLPHLAAFCGLASAVTFGPGDPNLRRPLGRIHSILTQHPECGPCLRSKCRLDHRCMLEITPDQACEAVSGILAGSQAAPAT